jgi:hypothetical protein
MNPEQDDLYQRICNFNLDDPGASYPFSYKLAAEYRWPRSYTMRAIQEYKKFLFLGMVADHIVSPSVPIDLVWHLHLTYTDSYWNGLCAGVLGKPLHHRPSLGGKQEQLKYDLLYQKTLATYQQYFGKLPLDIWLTSPQKIFNQQYLVIPNPIYWLKPKK